MTPQGPVVFKSTDAVAMIPGLVYHVNAITAEQERALLNQLDSDECVWTPITDSAKSRRIQHYGYRYDYKRRAVTEPTVAIPAEWFGIFGSVDENKEWNQVIVNEYLPGQGISAHVDSLAYGGVIRCYTLGSGATMRFTHVETGRTEELYVEPRSVYIMTGEARYQWKHEMVARKSDTVEGKKVLRGRRVSVTLRWV